MKIETKKLERRMRGFSEVCRRSGVKATHQRTEIYRELARTKEHPDAETIYARVRKRIPAMSLDTVYRTLRLLEEKKIVSRVGSLGERTRFDANTDRHHHFICKHCGYIGDFYNEELNDVSIPNDVEAMGTVISVHVELRGICKTCQGKQGGKG
jgi:Fur family peroxide stress response transcriptional regulator